MKRTTNILKFNILAAIATTSLVVTLQTQAACNFRFGTSQTVYRLNLPSTLNISRNTPIGSVVYQSSHSLTILNGGVRYGLCDVGDWSGIVNNVGARGANNRYPIGNTGLAWTWEYTGPTSVGATSYSPFGPYPFYSIPSRANIFQFPETSIFRIIKISNTVSGSIPSGEIGSLTAGGIKPFVWMNGTGTINIVQPTCTTPSKVIPLGSHRQGEFTGIGSGTIPQNFTIDLNNCPAGLAGISYRLDPVGTAINNTSGILALNSGGASGIGVQITRQNGNLLALGSVINFLRNPATGNYSIPLRARYYQTQAQVTPGRANSSLQFTISYD